jgi:hypothetical protein
MKERACEWTKATALAALLSAAAASCGDVEDQAEPVETTTSAIVGGSTAVPNEFPWQVRLGAGTAAFCGGSLVSPKWVLTAAHCVQGLQASNITVTVGDHDRTIAEGREQTRQGLRYFNHLWGLGKFNNDIALLELASPVTLNTWVQPIGFDMDHIPVGEIATASGWGTTTYQGMQPAKLRKAVLPMREPSTCGVSYPGNSLLCLGDADGSPGSCHGDSGGPYHHFRGGRWNLAGVSSAIGSPPCEFYVGYTSVFQFIPWIRNTIWAPLTVTARLSSGSIGERHYDPAIGNWTPWRTLSGATNSGPGMTLDSNGRMYLFSCINGQVNGRTSTNDGATWSGWTSMGGNCVDAPAAAISREINPQVTVFARGTDNLVRYAVWTGGAATWTALSGTVNSSVAATTNRGGRLVLFARRSDNAIWHRFREQGSTSAWTDWITLGSGSFSSGPAAIETGQGQLHVFAATAAATISRKFYNPVTGAWTGWSSLGGAVDPTSAPAVTESDGGTRLVVFARGSGNVLTHIFQDIRTETWSAWSPLGGSLASGPGAI